jgi:hypothetical protein
MSVSDTIFPGIGLVSRGIGRLFGELMPDMPERPTPQTPPPPPAAPDNTAALEARNAAAEEQRRRSQYGRASTNPTGGTGVLEPANVAGKTLLGY